MAIHKRTFAIIGLNAFGGKVLDTLTGKGCSAIAIDLEEENLERYKDIAGIQAVVLDATDEEALRRVGADRIDVAVVAFGSDIAASILVTTILKSLGVPNIVARAINPGHVRALKRVGATKVVFPDYDMAERVAHSILTSGVREFIEMATNFDIVQVDVPRKLVGKTLKEAGLNERFGINVIAVKHRMVDEEGTAKEEGVAELARENYILRKKDVLLVAGAEGKIEKFEEAMEKLNES